METQRINVTVERQPNGTSRAVISFYALSLVGIRASENRIAQDASYTFAFGDEEAHGEGLKQCEIKWPANEGWDHLAAFKPVTIPVEFREEIAP